MSENGYFITEASTLDRVHRQIAVGMVNGHRFRICVSQYVNPPEHALLELLSRKAEETIAQTEAGSPPWGGSANWQNKDGEWVRVYTWEETR